MAGKAKSMAYLAIKWRRSVAATHANNGGENGVKSRLSA